MAKDLYISGTEDSPEIHLNQENRIFKISGRSLPENANILFQPVFEWFTDYFVDPLPTTEFFIQLEYFNSATAKKIIELLLLFENQFENGNNLKIIWFYKRNDFTMQKKGQDLLNILKIPYEIRSL